MLKAIYIATLLFFLSLTQAQAQDFYVWLEDVKKDARSQGISDRVLEDAFHDIEPNETVVKLDRKQPEGTKTWTEYKRGALAQRRLDDGRVLIEENLSELTKASQRFGIPIEVITALWGLETSYGENTGGFSTIEALATLAYEGRRAEFFRKELIYALHILEGGHITADAFLGSWAGALGQCQFMPSSFHQFALDADGDGKRDIWNSTPDIFASIANYLAQSGWNPAWHWGYAVQLTQPIPAAQADIKIKKSLGEWQKLGIVMKDGSALPQGDWPASLIYPGKPEEGAYLVSPNYEVWLKWNRSRYFATSVGILSDLLAIR